MKTCSKCGLVGDDELFLKLRNLCKKCSHVYAKRHYDKHKEVLNNKSREYRKENKGKITEKNKKYNLKYKAIIAKRRKENYLQNKEVIDKRRRELRCNIRNNLSDSYVKLTLISKTDLKCGDIPHELIELKRAQLKLYRELRQK